MKMEEGGVLRIASKMTLGIDLGTTNSSVSVYYGGQMTVIPMGGFPSMPSVVRFPDRKMDNVQVGRTAKKYIVVKPGEVFSSIKSLMRNDDWKEDPALKEKFIIDGEMVTPTDIATKILAELKYQAEQWEHCDGNFEKVVVCVPANSTAIYKQHVKDAAVAAGFGITDKATGELQKDANGDVLGITLLEEPTAAALAYGVSKGFFNPTTSREQNILVYDLGGGTFDVTILHIVSEEGKAAPSFTPVSTKGLAKLGGDDLDWPLAQLLAKIICDETGVDIMTEPSQLANKSILKDKAEQVKIDFANGMPTEEVQLNLEIGSKDYSTSIAVDREDYLKVISPMVEKTLDCVSDTLRGAGMTMDDISRIILVGGSTKGPWIREAIKAKFNRDPYTADNVDTIVSQGASYYGMLDIKPGKDNPVKNTLSHYYGIELSDGTFSPMFEKGEELGEDGTLSRTATYHNSNDSGVVLVAGWATQEHLDIETNADGTKGTDTLVSSLNDNGDPLFEWLGEYEVKIPRKPTGQVDIQLTLTIDSQNCIHAKAVVDGKPTEADWKH